LQQQQQQQIKLVLSKEYLPASLLHHEQLAVDRAFFIRIKLCS
jgi:hypothetical protein